MGNDNQNAKRRIVRAIAYWDAQDPDDPGFAYRRGGIRYYDIDDTARWETELEE